MRFERTLQPFKGQFDGASFINLALLLALFLVAHRSFVFIPGVRLLPDGPDAYPARIPANQAVRILASGAIEFRAETFQPGPFLERLRMLAAAKEQLDRIILIEDPQAPPGLARDLRRAALDLRIQVESPSSPIRLPSGVPAEGILQATVEVAVNVAGQFYFDNRLCSEAEVIHRLRAATRRSTERLALVIWADRSVETGVLLRLVSLAREAGISDFYQAVRPGLFDGSNSSSNQVH